MKMTFKESYNLNNLPELHEEDIKYISGLANYILESFSPEAQHNLRDVVKEARKGSQLYNLIARESKSRLDGRKHVYFGLSEEEITEMEGQLNEDLVETGFTPSNNIMIGSIDPNCIKEWSKLEEKNNWAMVEHPIIPENIICYIPVLKEWTRKRLQERIDPVSHRNILRAAYEAFSSHEWKKEIIVERDTTQFGKISEVINR